MLRIDWRRLILGLLLVPLAGCGGEDAAPPQVPQAPGALAYEPPSFCFTGNQEDKTLTLYNLGDETLVWDPESVPAGSAGLQDSVHLDPGFGFQIPWTWTPGPGPYPILDSLVVGTNDPLRSRVVIRVRRDDPAGTPDTVAPDAPILFAPADGDTFTLAPGQGGNVAPIGFAWSALDDCSGIARYRLEIATSPTFGSTRVFSADTTGTFVPVVAEDGDEGRAYWRVTATDTEGLQGPPSEVRTFLVLPAP